MTVLPFWSVLGFTANFRKIGRNEGDFGGKLTHALTQVICDRYIDASISADSSGER